MATNGSFSHYHAASSAEAIEAEHEYAKKLGEVGGKRRIGTGVKKGR
jgi:hypothetical protein